MQVEVEPEMVGHYLPCSTLLDYTADVLAFNALSMRLQIPYQCVQVEVKPEMVGHYLAEFSISYKPVKHGRPGIGATHSSRFIPLK
jgi:hypothetical protein